MSKTLALDENTEEVVIEPQEVLMFAKMQRILSKHDELMERLKRVDTEAHSQFEQRFKEEFPHQFKTIPYRVHLPWLRFKKASYLMGDVALDFSHDGENWTVADLPHIYSGNFSLCTQAGSYSFDSENLINNLTDYSVSYINNNVVAKWTPAISVPDRHSALCTDIREKILKLWRRVEHGPQPSLFRRTDRQFYPHDWMEAWETLTQDQVLEQVSMIVDKAQRLTRKNYIAAAKSYEKHYD